jgi:hypothetical protein
MAFDALRLRNVIQLLGILSMIFQLLLDRAISLKLLTVFHIALLVGAAIQIRQTETALVTRENCDASVDFTVSCYCVLLMRHVGASLIPL